MTHAKHTVQTICPRNHTDASVMTCEWPYSDLSRSSWLTYSNALTRLCFWGGGVNKRKKGGRWRCVCLGSLTAVINWSTRWGEFCFVDYLVIELSSSFISAPSFLSYSVPPPPPPPLPPCIPPSFFFFLPNLPPPLWSHFFLPFLPLSFLLSLSVTTALHGLSL